MSERMNVAGAPYASRASMGKGDRCVWSFGTKAVSPPEEAIVYSGTPYIQSSLPFSTFE